MYVLYEFDGLVGINEKYDEFVFMGWLGVLDLFLVVEGEICRGVVNIFILSFY